MGYIAKPRGTSMAGAFVAALWAGPLFLLSMAIVSFVSAPEHGVGMDGAAEMIGVMISLTLISAPIGFLIAVVPNVLGTALMSMLGEVSEVARLGYVWLFAGVMLGGGVTAWLGDGDPATYLPMGITGGVSAIISWRFADWGENSASVADEIKPGKGLSLRPIARTITRQADEGGNQ